MNSGNGNIESSPGRILQSVQPARDLKSNWAVDLGKNLDEYLLNVCSGHISIEDAEIFTVNFAEAALLLQGSVQVYGRKVEYLYSLVLQALDFISEKSREEQVSGETTQQNANTQSSKDDVADLFFVFDDFSVDPKNMLDCTISRDATPKYLFKAPANLAMLEGECMDIGADSEELESYLLATSSVYRDFILLDPMDAVAVDSILECSGKGNTNISWRSSMVFKDQKSFHSPSRHTINTPVKFSIKKKQDAYATQSHCDDLGHESSDDDMRCFEADLSHGNKNGEYENNYQHLESGNKDSDEDDDPWKPLNPHEPGSLKVKPYKKVKAKGRRDSRKHHPLTAEFPLAKIHGCINSSLAEAFEARQAVSKAGGTSQPLLLYEKLRQSLVYEGPKVNIASYSRENIMEDEEYCEDDQEVGPPDDEFHSNACSDEDAPRHEGTNKDPEIEISLEDLCRSHLDSLLETLDENMMQSELSVKVSNWKQRIEETLEEQDARSPFDIHKYGETVLDKLSEEGDAEKSMSFADVVKGRTKYDVARTFSAILQLVNGGDVDFVRTSTVASSCHSTANPFYVRLVGSNTSEKGIPVPKKRLESSPVKKHPSRKSSPQRSSSMTLRFRGKAGKSGSGGFTPEGKKRRKSINFA